MYGILIGGWTVGLYFIQMIIENLHTILFVYQTYVFWYVIVTGFLSFIVCYRFGPPENQRSKDLIKWSLQFVANIMIFYSSSYHEASVGIMIVVLCIYYFPFAMIQKCRSFWYVRYKRQIHLKKIIQIFFCLLQVETVSTKAATFD